MYYIVGILRFPVDCNPFVLTSWHRMTAYKSIATGPKFKHIIMSLFTFWIPPTIVERLFMNVREPCFDVNFFLIIKGSVLDLVL